MSEEAKSLVVVESTPLGIPMMPIEELKRLTAYVNEVKKTLMIEGKDYVVDRGKQYTARSGFAKLHQGFTLSDEEPIITILWNEDMIGEVDKEHTFTHYIKRQPRKVTFSTRVFGFQTKVRVINLQTGRATWGEGGCTVDELDWTDNLSPKWYHRALGTAKTRAWNRAVSNYVGSAEVSAEEMGLVYSDDDAPPARRKADAKVEKVSRENAKPHPRKEKAENVNVTEYLKKSEPIPPEWGLMDELNRDDKSWDRGVEITTQWLDDAGFRVEGFEITVDFKKVAVKSRKEIPLALRPAITGVMLAGGFAKVKNGWRMNRTDVTG